MAELESFTAKSTVKLAVLRQFSAKTFGHSSISRGQVNKYTTHLHVSFEKDLKSFQRKMGGERSIGPLAEFTASTHIGLKLVRI